MAVGLATMSARIVFRALVSATLQLLPFDLIQPIMAGYVRLGETAMTFDSQHLFAWGTPTRMARFRTVVRALFRTGFTARVVAFFAIGSRLQYTQKIKQPLEFNEQVTCKRSGAPSTL